MDLSEAADVLGVHYQVDRPTSGVRLIDLCEQGIASTLRV
jgi:hypothetical protein